MSGYPPRNKRVGNGSRPRREESWPVGTGLRVREPRRSPIHPRTILRSQIQNSSVPASYPQGGKVPQLVAKDPWWERSKGQLRPVRTRRTTGLPKCNRAPCAAPHGPAHSHPPQTSQSIPNKMPTYECSRCQWSPPCF